MFSEPPRLDTVTDENVDIYEIYLSGCLLLVFSKDFFFTLENQSFL